LDLGDAVIHFFPYEDQKGGELVIRHYDGPGIRSSSPSDRVDEDDSGEMILDRDEVD